MQNYINFLIFKLQDNKLEDKRLCTEWQQSFPDFNMLLIFSLIQFSFLNVFTKYLKSSNISKDQFSIFVLWIRPSFWSRYKAMYLVLSAFTTSPFSLLAITKDSAFPFVVRKLPPNILSSST